MVKKQTQLWLPGAEGWPTIELPKKPKKTSKIPKIRNERKVRRLPEEDIDPAGISISVSRVFKIIEVKSLKMIHGHSLSKHLNPTSSDTNRQRWVLEGEIKDRCPRDLMKNFQVHLDSLTESGYLVKKTVRKKVCYRPAVSLPSPFSGEKECK